MSVSKTIAETSSTIANHCAVFTFDIFRRMVFNGYFLFICQSSCKLRAQETKDQDVLPSGGIHGGAFDDCILHRRVQPTATNRPKK